jgi:hypothetical protein
VRSRRRSNRLFGFYFSLLFSLAPLTFKTTIASHLSLSKSETLSHERWISPPPSICHAPPLRRSAIEIDLDSPHSRIVPLESTSTTLFLQNRLTVSDRFSSLNRTLNITQPSLTALDFLLLALPLFYFLPLALTGILCFLDPHSHRLSPLPDMINPSATALRSFVVSSVPGTLASLHLFSIQVKG